VIDMRLSSSNRWSIVFVLLIKSVKGQRSFCREEYLMKFLIVVKDLLKYRSLVSIQTYLVVFVQHVTDRILSRTRGD
jgi:hypothetical protein